MIFTFLMTGKPMGTQGKTHCRKNWKPNTATCQFSPSGTICCFCFSTSKRQKPQTAFSREQRKRGGERKKGGSSKQSSLQPVRTWGVLRPGSSTNMILSCPTESARSPNVVVVPAALCWALTQRAGPSTSPATLQTRAAAVLVAGDGE